MKMSSLDQRLKKRPETSKAVDMTTITKTFTRSVVHRPARTSLEIRTEFVGIYAASPLDIFFDKGLRCLLADVQQTLAMTSSPLEVAQSFICSAETLVHTAREIRVHRITYLRSSGFRSCTRRQEQQRKLQFPGQPAFQLQAVPLIPLPSCRGAFQKR